MHYALKYLHIQFVVVNYSRRILPKSLGDMTTIPSLGFLLFLAQTVGCAVNDYEALVVEKRDDCKGVVCREAPSDAGTCTKVPGAMSACCQDFECLDSHGTKSRHSGMVSSQSFGYDEKTPDGGRMQGFSSSSSSSSSSSGTKPGGMLPMPPMSFGSDFEDMKPMPGMPPMPKMPGFKPMGDFPPMSGMPPMPGFKPMGDFDFPPMSGMPPMPKMPGFRPMGKKR